MGFKIGICGIASFSRHFIPLFKVHPQVEEVVLADLMRERAEEQAANHGLRRVCGSLDELLETDVDAVFIATQRWLHAPQAVQALEAGKHVLSAVPAAVTLEELDELVKTVEKTGLLYMLNETSYYRPQTIWCRRRFARGDFGRFVYGEGQYHHDMSHFYRPYMNSNGERWREVASFPPMLYPTHSIAHVLSVTFRRMTHVTCWGFADDHPDGVFDRALSRFDNDFSNETALFRTSDGATARINEFRRIAAGESRQTIMGTLGAYEEQTGQAVWTDLPPYEGPQEAAGDGDGEKKWELPELGKRNREDVQWVREKSDIEITPENLGGRDPSLVGKRWMGFSSVHPLERLPDEFADQPNGHEGSHQLLVCDFLDALSSGKLPPNHVWAAARYNAPGIVAHESARRDGERLVIPDCGRPPADAALLDPLSVLQD